LSAWRIWHESRLRGMRIMRRLDRLEKFLR
jgi:hypothetical protein